MNILNLNFFRSNVLLLKKILLCTYGKPFFIDFLFLEYTVYLEISVVIVIIRECLSFKLGK